MSDPLTLHSTKAIDTAEQLWQLWQQGQRPDVDAFIARAGPLSPSQIAAVLRIDQRERWQTSERILAETYLLRYPTVRADSEAALDLIHAEFLLRERLGDRPSINEYVARFPEQADALRSQIELHQAMAGDSSHAAAPSLPSAVAALIGDTLPGDAPRDAVRQPPTLNDATPHTVDMPRRLPEVFGRYRILKMLGEGGMGTVYLAEDEQLHRRVALKVPRFSEGSDRSLIERFYREARIAATFTHPHLCPIHDFGQINGIHFLTMPFIPGESLSAWLKRVGRLPQRTAAQVACLIARALAVAHRAGVIHRDLKPANIMMNDRHEPVVMDFGLARRGTAHDPRVTASGVILGTPAYSPPEQIGGETDAIGPSCDVYSLGVMLYEMLAGRLPFQGTLNAIMRQVFTQQPQPPSSHCRDLDPRLEAICLQAMAKDPKERFASMELFAAGLEGYLTGAAPTVVVPLRIDKGRKRRVLGFLLASLVAVLLVGGIGWAILFKQDQPEPLPAKEPPDLLQTGTLWRGPFRFLPVTDRPPDGHASFTIVERDGNKFSALYTTEGSNYVWKGNGEITGEAVRWVSSERSWAKEPGKAAERVTLKGKLRGKTLEDVDYTDSDNDSAKMELMLQQK